MKYIHKLIAWITGKNLNSAPKELILDQLSEQRPLPMGVAEFHVWADRIVAGAMVTATAESQKFALAEMIMHMDPTKDHCDDGYFIKKLRKSAANQIAHFMMTTLHTQEKARLAAEEAVKPKAENVIEIPKQEVKPVQTGA